MGDPHHELFNAHDRIRELLAELEAERERTGVLEEALTRVLEEAEVVAPGQPRVELDNIIAIVRHSLAAVAVEDGDPPGSAPEALTPFEAANLLIWLEGVPDVTLKGPPIKDPMDKLRTIAASEPEAAGTVAAETA